MPWKAHIFANKLMITIGETVRDLYRCCCFIKFRASNKFRFMKQHWMACLKSRLKLLYLLLSATSGPYFLPKTHIGNLKNPNYGNVNQKTAQSPSKQAWLD